MTVPAQAATPAPVATTETTAAPSTESSQAPVSDSTSTANGVAAGEGVQTQPAWREAMLSADRDEVLRDLLESTDSDKLIKQPKLAGLLGDLAEKRARAKETEIERKIQDRYEQQRLKALRDEDPYAFAQELKRKEAEAEQATSTTEQHQRTLAVWAQDINSEIYELAKTLPKDITEALSKKKYEGTLGQGLRAYVADIIEASKEAWVNDAQAKWKTDLLPALRKEALAAVNGGDDIPDSTSGGSAPAGALSQAEWSRQGGNRIWRQANKDRINDALAHGRIRPLA